MKIILASIIAYIAIGSLVIKIMRMVSPMINEAMSEGPDFIWFILLFWPVAVFLSTAFVLCALVNKITKSN